LRLSSSDQLGVLYFKCKLSTFLNLGRKKERPSSGDQKKKSRPFDNPIPVDKPRPLPSIPNLSNEHSASSTQTDSIASSTTPSTPVQDDDGGSSARGKVQEIFYKSTCTTLTAVKPMH